MGETGIVAKALRRDRAPFHRQVVPNACGRTARQTKQQSLWIGDQVRQVGQRCNARSKKIAHALMIREKPRLDFVDGNPQEKSWLKPLVSKPSPPQFRWTGMPIQIGYDKNRLPPGNFLYISYFFN